jgi:peptide/nickel transport system permease protein
MATIALSQPAVYQPSRSRLVYGYLRRNKSLAVGLLILLGLVTFTVVGFATLDLKKAYPLQVAAKKPPTLFQWPPSMKYPLGTDFFGRDLTAAMVVGLWQTALIGVLAGALGTLIGTILGFISAYFGGWLDAVIKGICQILTPIPAFLIQIIIAGSIDKRDVTIYTMALVVVLLAWMGPTLVIRSQVLTMKERQFVSVAKLSGMGDLGIIFSEIMPNLLPFLAAAFVTQVFSAVFASFYLAILGLGPVREPLMGNTIWAAQSQSAIFNGWWWWPLMPAAAMVLILTSLALINMGMDELSNPRVRKTE